MIKLPKVRNPFAPERGTERINYLVEPCLMGLPW